MLTGVGLVTVPVFNLVPPLGVPASIGTSLLGFNSFQEASLRTGDDYGVSVSDITIPTSLEIKAVSETIWGVPADPSHDSERGFEALEGGPSVPAEAPLAPFLTLPTSCAGPLETTVRVESVEEPGVFQSETAPSLNDGGNEAGLNSCQRPPFGPTLVAQPETTVSDSPAGLQVNLHIPQNKDPDGLATAHLKDTVVTLPPGMVVNPSAATGRGACSSAQVDLDGPGPANCPANSKVGTVAVHTPLLDHSVNGAVYLAKQGDNPFSSLLGIYIAVEDPLTGIVVKLAGKVEPDPLTGQLRTTFKDNPQLPFEDFELDFFGGSRAALTTPPTCPIEPGATSNVNTTTAILTPWTSPEGQDKLLSDSFTITTAPGGGPCAQSEAQMPNKPVFEAGTVNSLGGSYAPFVLKISRENGSQRFGALNVTLPKGLSAKLAGVAECSEAQIAAAATRKNPGEGALELASPSCPAASEVGIVNVGVGSGTPFYAQGHAYLAGPYRGAPLSLAVIAPAVAGPFDLGVVVVRSALHVDESSAQVTVKSDPLPTILQGIPLDVRSIAVQIDRPQFSLNPTNCEQMAVAGQSISTTGAVAQLSSRFQAGGCRNLPFSPKLSLSMKGATRRSGHPALTAVLTQPQGQANISRAAVILPPTEFIDQNHIANPCTRPQFAEGKCPPASVLGTARAFTPLLDNPLEGKVYFRANGGERELPDIVADLNGKVHFVLVGFVDAVTRKGSESSRVRTVFANAPDAPVSKFVLKFKGGKKGVLVNSANICKVPNAATVKMKGQNGKATEATQRIGTSCGSAKRRR